MRVLVMSLLLGLSTSPAVAQAPLATLQGHRVWLREPDSSGKLSPGIQGTVTATEGDTLVLETPTGGPFRIAVSPSTQIAISTGFRSSAGRGARRGLIIGAAVGLALGVAGSIDCIGPRVDDCYHPGLTTAVGAMDGLILGTIIGALRKHETWENADAVRPIIAAAEPGGGGWGLGLRLSF